MGMIYKYNVGTYSTDVGSLVGGGSINEFWVCELADERRDLGAHPMLRGKCFMRVALEDKTFEKRPVQVVSLSLFNG